MFIQKKKSCSQLLRWLYSVTTRYWYHMCLVHCIFGLSITVKLQQLPSPENWRFSLQIQIVLIVLTVLIALSVLTVLTPRALWFWIPLSLLSTFSFRSQSHYPFLNETLHSLLIVHSSIFRHESVIWHSSTAPDLQKTRAHPTAVCSSLLFPHITGWLYLCQC